MSATVRARRPIGEANHVASVNPNRLALPLCQHNLMGHKRPLTQVGRNGAGLREPKQTAVFKCKRSVNDIDPGRAPPL
ncbi:MAG: hypothetical protein KDE56_07025 [Anaerolineales bacterium]|nr:hypothetical protein [Anaerolineales bacterium]